MNIFDSVDEAVYDLLPQQPLCCVRPHIIRKHTEWFVQKFPGKILYSVKSNPDPEVLKVLYASGVKHFDVASMHEIELISKLFPSAPMHFMHPVKSRQAISRAYEEFGIRCFVLDSFGELQKILDETGFAQDLTLVVRLATPNKYSELDLSGKFGAAPQEAERILRYAEKFCAKLGVSFHVGSQCMNPQAYTAAIDLVRQVVAKAGVALDILDIGGGFPSIYPGMTPPPMQDYMDAALSAIRTMPNADALELWCEPGRALVAESSSIVVKVELRKGNLLYINDGVYGSLFDAGTPEFVFPTKLIRTNSRQTMTEAALQPFTLFGPTCDSIDRMKGPFFLPEDIEEGDYIEIGQLGAYGRTMQTNFNGFGSDLQVVVKDQPILTLATQVPAQEKELPYVREAKA